MEHEGIKMVLTVVGGIFLIALLFTVSHTMLTSVDFEVGYNKLRVDGVECDISFSAVTKVTSATYNVTVTDPVSGATYTFTDAASYNAMHDCVIGQVYDCKYHVNTRQNKFVGYSDLELVDVLDSKQANSEEL